jgi:mRNA interferase HigB
VFLEACVSEKSIAPVLGAWQDSRRLRILSRSTLVEFWQTHPDAEKPLRLWFSLVEKAAWQGPPDIAKVFGSADFLPENRVVFDIKGNSYRLIVRVKYAPLFLVFIRFIGTHAQYSRVDATKV